MAPAGKANSVPIVASDKLAAHQGLGRGRPGGPLGRRLRRLRRARRDRLLDDRLRDRARRPARLAHRRHRGDAVHHRRHRQAPCEDGTTYPVGPGSVFVLPTPVRHDLVNTGTETLRAVAFFAAAMFTQTFDNVMMPPKSHILGTPNREGETGY